MSERTELYRHFDRDGKLLYVGIAMSTTVRAQAHRGHSGWWKQVERITIERFPSRAEALAAELRAIQTENPVHNKQGKGLSTVKPPTKYLEPSIPEGAGAKLAAYFRERGFGRKKAT